MSSIWFKDSLIVPFPKSKFVCPYSITVEFWMYLLLPSPASAAKLICCFNVFQVDERWNKIEKVPKVKNLSKCSTSFFVLSCFSFPNPLASPNLCVSFLMYNYMFAFDLLGFLSTIRGMLFFTIYSIVVDP